MNPSANGWIKKLLREVSETEFENTGTLEFYSQLKETGFIYGSNIKVVLNIAKKFDFTEEERSKINLLLTFYYIYKKEKPNIDFIDSLVGYYKVIGDSKKSFFNELFGDHNPDRTLEKVIHKRIHIDDSFISKNFSYILINALLFVDVLGYKKYLEASQKVKLYVENLESALETIVFFVIDAKEDKSGYDDNLIKLFESSIRHKNTTLPTYKEAVSFLKDPLEKYYIVDLVCMASWTDKIIDKAEKKFLKNLKEDLSIEDRIIDDSVRQINNFYIKHKDEVTFLSSKNLAQSFYDNSSKVVIRLIKRNSKRLIKELSESKEALYLLSQSTLRNLSDEEQKKVQSQLMDIFKSIPSLAIFMLPGGMILLPLFVKFIPKLLPSAFDDNRIEED